MKNRSFSVSERESDRRYELRKLSIEGEGNYYFDTLSGTELVRVFNKSGDFLCNIRVENSNLGTSRKKM